MDVIEGHVWWARPSPVVGREQAGRRPVVVVSGEEYQATVTTFALVVPVTTTDRGWLNHVRVHGPHRLDRPSWAMTEQVRTVSRERLVDAAGAVDDATLAAIRSWVADYLR